jgi:hypothetical protein
MKVMVDESSEKEGETRSLNISLLNHQHRPRIMSQDSETASQKLLSRLQQSLAARTAQIDETANLIKRLKSDLEKDLHSVQSGQKGIEVSTVIYQNLAVADLVQVTAGYALRRPFPSSQDYILLFRRPNHKIRRRDHRKRHQSNIKPERSDRSTGRTVDRDAIC